MNRQILWIAGAVVIALIIFVGFGATDLEEPEAVIGADTPAENTGDTEATLEDRAELGAADEDTAPATAASEIATDEATEIARDSEPGAAIGSRDEALEAAGMAGTVGAIEALTVEGYDRVEVEGVLSEADLPREARESYMTRLDDASGNAELGEVLADLRAELGVSVE